MDDSVKTQQLLISYAMQKGGWKNMPLPSDWIQTTVGNTVIYINCSGCTVLDVHPFKYLALGNEKEKKLVKAHIAEQYDPKKKKANYISCWATCPFPESDWMKLYHVNKNQILYYHTTSNTLTAKHPCRAVNKSSKSLSDSKASPSKPPPLLSHTKDNKISLSLDLDTFIENDLQKKTKHGKSQKKIKRLRSSAAACTASTPPALSYTASKGKGKEKKKHTKSSKIHTMQLTKPKPDRRTKSSMRYKDMMANRPAAAKTARHEPKLKLNNIQKLEKKTDTNTSKKLYKHKKKSKTNQFTKKFTAKSKKIPSKKLHRSKTSKQLIRTPKKDNSPRTAQIKYGKGKVQNVSIASVSKTHKPQTRRRAHTKSKSMKMRLKGKGNRAKNKHKLTFKTKPKPRPKHIKTEPRIKKKNEDNDLPKWSPISHSCDDKRKKVKKVNLPNTPKKTTKEMIKKSNRKTAQTKKKVKFKTPKSPKTKKSKSSSFANESISLNDTNNNQAHKPLAERLGKRPATEETKEAQPTKEMKQQFASNLNGYNWNKTSSYTRSLPKSVFMYASSRSNNVLFPFQNKSNPPPSRKVTITPAKNASSATPNGPRVRTRMSRSKSNPDSKAADIAIRNVQRHFKVSSPNKRRRNAVGMSSQLQSQLLAFNEAIEDGDRDKTNNNIKRTVSINLNLKVRPKHNSNPTTPTLLTQSTSKEDIAVGEAAAEEEPFPTIKEVLGDLDLNEDTTLEIKSNINGSNSDEEIADKDSIPSMIRTAAVVSYDGFQTASKLVVREKKTSGCETQLSKSRLKAHENRSIKPRSRSHSRALRKKKSHSRASSLSSTSSIGSVSEDNHHSHRVRRPSSSSSDSSDESSVSSVSNSYSSDSDSDSTISDTSSISSRSSRSSRHSRSSSIHSRGSRSSTPIARNKRLSNTTDKLINAQSSLLGNMANMMQLMSQQQQQGITKDTAPTLHVKSASTGFPFLNINDTNANNKATGSSTQFQFDEFMNNFMTNFNSNGNNNNNKSIFNTFGAANGININRANAFNKTNNVEQGLEELLTAPIMLQNSMTDDTSDNDIETPPPV